MDPGPVDAATAAIIIPEAFRGRLGAARDPVADSGAGTATPPPARTTPPAPRRVRKTTNPDDPAGTGGPPSIPEPGRDGEKWTAGGIRPRVREILDIPEPGRET